MLDQNILRLSGLLYGHEHSSITGQDLLQTCYLHCTNYSIAGGIRFSQVDILWLNIRVSHICPVTILYCIAESIGGH